MRIKIFIVWRIFNNYYGSPTPNYRNYYTGFAFGIFLWHGNGLFLREQNSLKNIRIARQEKCEGCV